MNEWALSLAIVIFVVTVLTIILPEGKLGKTVKGFLSFVIILIMIKPILNVDKISLEFYYQSGDFFNQSQIQYLDYIFSQKVTNYQNLCDEIANNCGIKGGQTRIEYIVNENNVFQIAKVNIFIAEKQEFDNVQLDNKIDCVINEIANKLMIDKNVVTVNVVS